MIAADGIGLGDVGYQAHPEVWVLMAGIVAIAVYMKRVLEPKAVAAGHPPMTRRQQGWYLAAALSLWGVSDWPVHNVAEQYLYSAHMLQHLFISMLVPAMFLLALPNWLFLLLMPEGSRSYRLLRRASAPLVAGVSYNALTAFLHWTDVVEASARYGPLHFSLHLVIFLSGLLMWMPVLSPVKSWRLKPLAQCIYLFMMSIVPTVPGGWLVFANDVVYRNYDTPQRLWGIDALSDQQAAGAIMKLVGGFVLWGIIVTIFTKWAGAEMRRDEEERKARQKAARLSRMQQEENEAAAGADVSLLTFEHVAEEFARTPAPTEPRS